MTQDIKDVLKLALEALEKYCTPYLDGTHPADEAITAIKEALAQPAQQEPEHIVRSNGRYSPLLTRMMNERVKSNLKQVIELYDSPDHSPQRTWVGLTDEEVESYWDWEDFQCGCGRGTLLDMVRDIEAKLKQLNT